MSRPLRIEFPGAVYHVIARGIEKKKIFEESRDKAFLLSLLALLSERYEFAFHAYCIMDNHYHLLIRTPRGNLSRGMRDANAIYARTFNRKNSRCGPLFQGRYKAYLVEEENYLLVSARYIVLNPVRAGICTQPSAYPWCSYRATAGLGRPPSFLSIDPLLCYFSLDPSSARRQYREFVSAGLGEEPHLPGAGGVILGTQELLARVREYIEPKRRIDEIPKQHRFQDRLSLCEIFAEASDRCIRSMRNDKIITAFRTYGYTQKEIGEHLGIDHSTVSLIIRTREKA